MNLFQYLAEHGHEQLIFSHDEASGLRAIISIHDSSRGRALGGVRYQSYPNEEAAVMDALRLSEAMTYKFAAAGLAYGGAKAVIIKQGETPDRVALFRAFGRVVESLQGRFGTGEDVGTTPEDMAAIALETSHVTGLPVSLGGEGDPSPVTALGVLQGMRAGLEAVFGNDRFDGRTVAIQGLGNVGYNLASRLHERGARLIVTDTSTLKVQRAVEEFGAEAVGAEEIYDAGCDVFSPCALGGTLSRETIGRLRCSIVAGAANNQLAEPLDGRLLDAKGILYLPDFVINAGGVLFLTYRLRGVTEQDAFRETEGIYHTTRTVIDISRSSKIPTSEAAFILARNNLKRTEAA